VELYSLGVNTLEATMNVLRLHNEWELHTKPLYESALVHEEPESTKISFENASESSHREVVEE
jgi:hypothetical protein|tara:strand:+ start:66 stop:254 length:189 start_codon:yes stop_codon:yes gene_type:complete